MKAVADYCNVSDQAEAPQKNINSHIAPSVGRKELYYKLSI